MKNYQKYSKGYFMPPEIDLEWAKKDAPDKAPVWCSVDMRDGNQALIIPMNLDEKLEFYKMLLKVGFKEIEVGFPAASETEYEFLRRLVEDDLIPDDVTIQVLTQAREHIIRKTFEALKGVKNAIVHVYNSTSVAQREQVFLPRVKTICRSIFRGKDCPGWPTKVVKGANWDAIYERQKLSLTVLASVDEAVAWANRLIQMIDET